MWPGEREGTRDTSGEERNVGRPISHLQINLSALLLTPTSPPLQLHSIQVLKIIKRGNKIYFSAHRAQAEGQFLLETLSDIVTWAGSDGEERWLLQSAGPGGKNN